MDTPAPASQAVAGAITEDKRQVLGLVPTSLVGGMIGVMPLLGWIMRCLKAIGPFVLRRLGLVSALQIAPAGRT